MEDGALTSPGVRGAHSRSCKRCRLESTAPSHPVPDRHVKSTCQEGGPDVGSRGPWGAGGQKLLLAKEMEGFGGVGRIWHTEVADEFSSPHFIIN